MDNKTKELAAVAAAVACNCMPCFIYHHKQAEEAGCAPEDIKEAVELAKMIKQRPAKDMEQLARKHTGGETA